MLKTIQCKDIPDRPILELLAAQPADCIGIHWYDPDKITGFKTTVRLAMPSGLPDKLVLAKMKQLIGRGLVDGCDCGCRGDFTITDKGRAWLSAQVVSS